MSDRKGMSLIRILLLILALLSTEARASPAADIVLSATRIAQGESGSLVIRGAGGAQPHARWLGNPLFLLPDGEGRTWYGFFGVDLEASPGKAFLEVERHSPEGKQRLEVTIVAKDRGVRRLTLPREMVELDRQTLDRVQRESLIMKDALGAPPSEPRWSGPFGRPLEGSVVGPFGTRSVINDLPRAPHSGVDLKASLGAPVEAIQNGRVVLVVEHFFSGKSVVIDHGGAIQSLYFHLDDIKVCEGEGVAKGQVIGLAGATGRATGPHLHFGVRVNGARVDPLHFLLLSEQTGRP